MHELDVPSELSELFYKVKVVALCGAGVSTASGIPDYRGKDGLWIKSPKALEGAHISNYLAKKELRERAWLERLSSPYRFAEPNKTHFVLQKLVSDGHLQYVVTQNVDGLQSTAGTPADRLIEIHGNLRESLCLSCGNRVDMEKTLVRVAKGELDPRCDVTTEMGSCGGVLKSTAISFGQPLGSETIKRAQRAFGECEMILVLGSSLTVNPISAIVRRWKRAGKTLAIVNSTPTRCDDIADFVIRGDVGEVLEKLAEDTAPVFKH